MQQNYKRVISCFALFLCVMAIVGLRLYMIATDQELLEVANTQSTRKIRLSSGRGDIFDCNGTLLVNTKTQKVTVIFPTDEGISAVQQILKGEDLLTALNSLKNGTPVILEDEYSLPEKCGTVIDVPIRYSDTLSHVIGYINGAGHGVSGVEKGLDDLLFNQDGISLKYSINPSGKMVSHTDWSIDYGSSGGSVMLTIDSKIQKIVENAMSNTEAGATVVLDAKNGKIRAMLSKPDFDPQNIGEYLNDENAPLINRALYSYNVGSVFKPCLATAALECQKGDYTYNCTGSVEIDGITFRCNSASGHGHINLKQALAVSCNTYFYTLGSIVTAKEICSTAGNLRFGYPLDLGAGLISSAGNFPSLSTLELLPASLTNLSIGQGDLLLSPIAMTTLYASIVNGGKYVLPSIVEGVSTDGVFKRYETSLPTKVMSSETASILKDYLENVVIEGTGSSAHSDGIITGGKTGTAQTGWKDGDRHILNGWFCGFLEGVFTDYVIVILKEDVKSSSTDCAPIFKAITTEMTFNGY